MKNKKALSIKNWAEEDRPREKLLSQGVHNLSNAELIAILLGSGNTEESAVDLSKRILNDCDNNLFSLSKKRVKELLSYKGIGQAKAVSLVAALSLGRRIEIPHESVKITSSQIAANILIPIIGNLDTEEFWVLFLNRANKVIDKKRISQGGISGTVVEIKIIVRHAIEELASSLIIAHNHPSGNLLPSEQDTQITKKLSEACKLFDINLLDHIIISEGNHYSFADNGNI